MANRYWVGGSAVWDATAGTKWSTTSGGAGGAAVPTTADDVFFNAASGASTVTTVSNTQNFKSLDCTGFTGSLQFGGTATCAGGITLVSGMTLVATGSTVLMNATTDNGGSPWIIELGGKSLNAMTLSGVGGSWKLGSNSTFVAAFNLGAGTFSTDNKNLSVGTFASIGTTARTLTLGSSTVTVVSNSAGWSTTSTGLTVTSNTATVSFTGTAAQFAGSNVNFNGTSFTMNGAGAAATSGSWTAANFTRVSTAVKTDTLSVSGNPVVTGTLTLTGDSATNRLLVFSDVIGTTRTISAAVVSLTNVDFADITGAGAATWSGTSIGNALGNSNITFTTPVTRYCVSTGGAVDLDSTTMWATTSGGTPGASVPLCHDDVVFDANSGATNNRLNQTRFCRNLTVTSGFVRSLTATNSTATTIYGDVVFGANMTGLGNSSAGVWQLSGRGAQTIQMNGASFSNTSSSGLVSIITPSGSYSMQDAFSGSSGTLNVQAGTLNTNNYSITIPSFLANQGAKARTVNLGTSIVTVSTWAASGVTLNASSSTIVIANASTASRTFGGGGLTYGTLNYTVANSPGTLAITGSNTFGTLNIGPGRTFAMVANGVTTVGSLNTAGQNNGYLYIGGSSSDYAGTPDATQNQITGDIDIRVDMAPNSWTAGTSGAVIGKDSVGGAGRVWQMGLTANGVPTFTWWDSGGALRGTFSASTAVSFTGNTRGWIRVTLDVDNGSGGHALKFWTSPAGTPVWTQLGSTLSAGAFTTSMRNQSALVSVGSAGGSSANPAKFYRAQIRNNILDDGTGIVVDMNFSAKAFGANTFTESSVNAATVTLAGTALVGDGRVTLASLTASSPTYLMLAGEIQSFDYLAVQDVVSLLPYKFYAGTNSVNVSGNTNVLFSNYVTSTPYPAFVAEIAATGTSHTIPLVIPPGQAVLANDVNIVMSRINSITSVASASGYSAAGSKVADSVVSGDILWKAASGGETSVTLLYSASGNVQAQFLVMRGLTGAPQLDVSDSNTIGGSSVTSLATGSGSGVTNTDVPAFAVASWMSNGALGASVSYSDSFLQGRAAITEQTAVRVAIKPLSSLVANKSTLTWTTAGTRAVGRMTIFRSTPSGAFLPFFM